MISRFVIAFLPRTKCLLMLWLQSLSAVILEPKGIKSVPVSTFFPIYLSWSDGTVCQNLSFFECWVLSQVFHSNCCFLTCIQVSQETDKVVWNSHLFKNFPQFVVICTIKDFKIVNEAKVDVLLEFSCFFYDPMNAGNLISGSSAFSKSSFSISKFSVHVLLKPSLKDFEHYLAFMWNEHNCMVIWALFSIAFLWDWNENWPFLVLWPLLSFPDLLTYWVQHFIIIYNN